MNECFVFRLAQDSELRAYALGDLKLNRYSGICLQRHTSAVLNLCRHLQHTKLPNAASWPAKAEKLCKIEYKEFCADVLHILDPARLVCNYQLPKRQSWQQFIAVVASLYHMTHPSDDAFYNDEEWPYERAAKAAYHDAVKEKAHCKTVQRRKEQMEAFGDDWRHLPRAVHLIADQIKCSLSGTPDIPKIQSLVDGLPLPPGVPTRHQMAALERKRKQEDLMQDDDWCREIEEEIKRKCSQCNGSGFEMPTKTCFACKGSGKN